MLYQCVVSFLWAKPTKLTKGPQILFSRKNSKKSGKVGSSKYANAWFKSLELNFCLYISSKFIVRQGFKCWNYCPNFQCGVKHEGASFIGIKAPKVD
jgi:hypothetical protein